MIAISVDSIKIGFEKKNQNLKQVLNTGYRLTGFAGALIEEKYAELAALTIDPEDQDEGLGKQLLKKIESTIRKYNTDVEYLFVQAQLYKERGCKYKASEWFEYQQFSKIDN